MYGGLTLRAVGVIAAVVILFTSGWLVNGWRWNGKMQELVAAQNKARLDAEQRVRSYEQQIMASVTEERNKKDAQIRTIRTQLDAALIELRNRPTRVQVPPTATDRRPGTGAELFREDAEFLAREAARADELRAELMACYASYEAARKSLRE